MKECAQGHTLEDLHLTWSDCSTLFVITKLFLYIFKHLSLNYSEVDTPKLKSHVPEILKFDYLYKWGGRKAKFKQYLNLI